MTHEPTVYECTWHGINVRVTYTPYYTNGFFFGGTSVLSHLEVQAHEPLPITETGYRSIFFFQDKDQMMPDPEQCVRDSLDEGAKSKTWQKFCADQLQPDLFM